MIILITPYFFLTYYENTDGYMISSITIWFFFVLVNAYYGGALVMYFASEISIPFETTSDVLRAYPDWKLITEKALQVFFQGNSVPQGEEDLYSDFMDRLNNDPEDTTIADVKEGLSKLDEEQAVLFTLSSSYKAFFRSNPFHDQKYLEYKHSKLDAKQ